ncbi:hypothetical protein UPYG_G00300930 [Umbra pygmaea]|uniref:C-type lectin domain-containing protein n=1 Tax=Umbra pygmaea TaxID=75934 RepID=A0ABD0W7C0_UMBPY
MDPPAPTLQKSLYLWSVVGVVLLVQVGGDLTGNVARNGTATQSSEYLDDDDDNNIRKASNAIDGNYQSCSSTKKEINPWWRVDLLKWYRVSSVSINVNSGEDGTFNMIDGAEIRIGNSLENNATNNPRCVFISRIPEGMTQTFPCYEMQGQYVSIHIPGENKILRLCEVEVYGILNDSLTGNCSSTTSLPHEYHFVDQNKTWTEAQSYCRQKYTDLATIDNTEDMNRLMETGNSGFKTAWGGLKKNKTQGKWQWSDQSSCSFRNWYVGQPDNQNENQECVEIQNETSFWDDMNCEEKIPFFCHHDHLILIDENKTWWEARSYCRQNHKDLVSVTSEKVQRWVEAKAKRASTPHVWLGLRYTCTLNIWFWVSGDPTCYHNWAPGNGTFAEECGGTRVGRTGAVQRGLHQWVSLPDTEQLNFICSV